jgi:KAP family P-loop domain
VLGQEDQGMDDIYLISDTTSANDLLNFKRYISPLLQILENFQTQTPFTIGIFGAWGTGKSTLMEYIEQRLAKSVDIQFYRIQFNPWIYRREKNLIVPLLHSIQDDLAKSKDAKIIEAAKKIGTVLARVGAALLLKTVTANQVTLDDLEKQEQVYMEQYKRAKSEMRKLRNELQGVINEITNNGQSTGDRQAGRVIFFIDDLDRCEPDQIVALMESIKLFLDLKYCFFMIALDEEVIHRAIQIKYTKFNFSDERKNQIGREYLEKMIQLPLYLYPLSETEVKEYLNGLGLPPSVKKHADLFAQILFNNPRKIKRIVNLFLLNLGVLDNNDSLRDQIDQAVLARLITIQVQDFDLYSAILKHKDLPKYLSKVYRNELQTSNPAQWAALDTRRNEVIKLCERYHRPGSWLERIFEPENSFPAAAQMGDYFNMIGQVVRN